MCPEFLVLGLIYLWPVLVSRKWSSKKNPKHAATQGISGSVSFIPFSWSQKDICVRAGNWQASAQLPPHPSDVYAQADTVFYIWR